MNHIMSHARESCYNYNIPPIIFLFGPLHATSHIDFEKIDCTMDVMQQLDTQRPHQRNKLKPWLDSLRCSPDNFNLSHMPELSIIDPRSIFRKCTLNSSEASIPHYSKTPSYILDRNILRKVCSSKNYFKKLLYRKFLRESYHLISYCIC